jgi:hypothetical protein
MGYDAEYEELLAKAKSSPELTDFQQLRFAYARSSHYAPYFVSEGDQRSLSEATGQTDGETAMKAIDRTLESNYLDIRAHISAASVYRGMGDAERATYHGRFAGGLLQSVLRSGDGRTPETAFVVINVAEEYAVLGSLGLELRTQALLAHKGHRFDEMRAHDSRTGKETTLYFNIDLPHTWLERQMAEHPEGLVSAFGAQIGAGGGSGPKAKRRWQFWK